MKNEKLTPDNDPSYSNSSMESGKDKEKPKKETSEQKESREEKKPEEQASVDRKGQEEKQNERDREADSQDDESERVDEIKEELEEETKEKEPAPEHQADIDAEEFEKFIEARFNADPESDIDKAIEEAEKRSFRATDELDSIAAEGFGSFSKENFQDLRNHPGAMAGRLRGYLNAAKANFFITEADHRDMSADMDKIISEIVEINNTITQKINEGQERAGEEEYDKQFQLRFDDFNKQVKDKDIERRMMNLARKLRGKYKETPEDHIKEILEEAKNGQMFKDEETLEYALKRLDKYNYDGNRFGSIDDEKFKEINDMIKELNAFKENAGSLTDEQKKKARELTEKIVKELQNKFQGIDFEQMEDRNIQSLEDLARLIMTQESEDWNTGGKTELVDKEGNLKINNFYAYVKNRLLYFDDLTPDSPIQLFSEVQFPTTFRNITLGEILNGTKYYRKKTEKLIAMTDRNGSTMLDRNGNVIYRKEASYGKDDEYQNLMDSLKVEIWMYNRDHDFDAMYRLVLGQREELKKQLGEILYGNVMTQSRDRILRFLRLPGSTEGEMEEGGALHDILENSSFAQEAQGRVGKIVRRSLLAYFHISDERMIQKIFEPLGMEAYYDAVINDLGGIYDGKNEDQPVDESKLQGYDRKEDKYFLNGRMEDVLRRRIPDEGRRNEFKRQYEEELNRLKNTNTDELDNEGRAQLLADKRKFAIKMGMFIFPEDKNWDDVFKKQDQSITNWEEREKEENYIWRDWDEIAVDTLAQNELYQKGGEANYSFEKNEEGEHILRDEEGREVLQDRRTKEIIKRNDDGDLVIGKNLLKDMLRDIKTGKLVTKKEAKDKGIETEKIEEVVRGRFVYSEEGGEYEHVGDLAGDYEMLFNPFNSHVKDPVLVSTIRKGIRAASQTLEQRYYEEREGKLARKKLREENGSASEEELKNAEKAAREKAAKQKLLEHEDVFYGENFVWRMTSWTGIASNQETKARCVDKLGNILHMGQYLFGRQIKGRGQYGIEDMLPGMHKLGNTYWETIKVKEEGDIDYTTPLIHAIQGGPGDEINLNEGDIEKHNIKDFEFLSNSERQYLIDSLYESFNLFSLIRNQKGLGFTSFVSKDPLTGELHIDHEKADEIFYTLWHNVRYAYDNSGHMYNKKLRGGLTTITKEIKGKDGTSRFIRTRLYKTQRMLDRMLDDEPKQMDMYRGKKDWAMHPETLEDDIASANIARGVLAYMISKELLWHRKSRSGQERWEYGHYQLIKQYLTHSLPLDAQEIRKNGVRSVVFTDTFFNEEEYEEYIAKHAGVQSKPMFRARLALDSGAGAISGGLEGLKHFLSSAFSLD